MGSFWLVGSSGRCETHVMGVRPLLFVDIDGVLNPWGVEIPPGFTEHHLFPGENPVRVSTLHGEWLHELSCAYELMWGTTWSGSSRALLATVLDLPDFTDAIRLPIGPFDPAMKVPAVDALAGERPLAWIDDMLGDEAWSWAQRRSSPTLLLPIDPNLGLTREDVDRLLTWPTAVALGRQDVS
jgi:hypothetical protein